MNRIDIAKKVTSFVVGTATAAVVKQIILNNTTPEKVTDKAAVMVGCYVLGGIAADASKKWTDAKIDELVEAFKKIRTRKEIISE